MNVTGGSVEDDASPVVVPGSAVVDATDVLDMLAASVVVVAVPVVVVVSAAITPTGELHPPISTIIQTHRTNTGVRRQTGIPPR
jgi:hypothetical protein